MVERNYLQQHHIQQYYLINLLFVFQYQFHLNDFCNHDIDNNSMIYHFSF